MKQRERDRLFGLFFFQYVYTTLSDFHRKKKRKNVTEKKSFSKKGTSVELVGYRHPCAHRVNVCVLKRGLPTYVLYSTLVWIAQRELFKAPDERDRQLFDLRTK